MPNRVTYTFQLKNMFSGAARKIRKSVKGLKFDMDKLKKAAKAAGRAVAGGFALMKKGAIALQSSMAPLLAAFAGVAGVLKFFSLGLSFEDAMADMSAITRTTGENLAFVREESLRLSKVARSDASSIATAFKLVGSGMSELLEDPKGFSKVVENVLLLKNATGGVLDLAAAAGAVTKSLNAFEAGAEDANRFVNVLAAGAGVGASEISDITEAMREAGPASLLAKMSFEETNAALQVMAKRGVTFAARAGTKFKMVVTRLEVKLRKGLRPSVIGFTNSLRALKPIVNDTTALSKLFGDEAFGIARVLIQNVDLVDKWTKAFTGTNIAQEQATVQLNTLSSKAKGLGIIIANSLIKTFERLTPLFEGVVKDMTKFFDSITEQDIKKFADDLRPIITLFVQLASAMSSIASFMTPVLGFLGNAAGSFGNMGNLLEVAGAGRDVGGFASAAGFKSPQQGNSQTKIDMTINDPGGMVGDIKTKTDGGTKFNVGVNVAG